MNAYIPTDFIAKDWVWTQDQMPIFVNVYKIGDEVSYGLPCSDRKFCDSLVIGMRDKHNMHRIYVINIRAKIGLVH